MNANSQYGLKGLTRIEELDLRFTQITDAGLDQLKGLANLRSLNLSRTQVTEEGVRRLQQALPNCEIEH
ncbi:MAG TPA: leucine-rich repeat domain-containing protein [Thermoguttaceae bacterium]|nr:leucine-rich repeat domain-containing protein [Thermoguttaceae bacterium]